MRDMAVLATRVRREREREAAQVERARGRVAAGRDAAAAVLPTGERVRAMMRAALAPHIGQVLTVRVGGSGRGSETMEIRLLALHETGALCRHRKGGWGCWLAYHDLYAGYTAILAPSNARDAMGRAVARLRRGAPRGDRG